MTALNKPTYPKRKNESDTIRIGTNKISGRISVFKFRDKDTRQIIHFAPCLDLTGYGSNDEKSFKMLKFSITDFFDHLMTLPQKKENKR
jgi:hypothetical protein